MARVNKTIFALLGMLSIEPMSGYDIRQTMRESTANFWSESDGQLYPALAYLTKQGMITCQSDKKNQVRNKKIYSLTSKGMDTLKHWLMQEADTNIIRSEFLLKIFFGANVAPAINLEHVRAQRYQAKTQLSQLIATKEQLSQDYKKSPHLPFWLMSVEYGIQMADARITWCDHVIDELENKFFKNKLVKNKIKRGNV